MMSVRTPWKSASSHKHWVSLTLTQVLIYLELSQHLDTQSCMHISGVLGVPTCERRDKIPGDCSVSRPATLCTIPMQKNIIVCGFMLRREEVLQLLRGYLLCSEASWQTRFSCNDRQRFLIMDKIELPWDVSTKLTGLLFRWSREGGKGGKWKNVESLKCN